MFSSYITASPVDLIGCNDVSLFPISFHFRANLKVKPETAFNEAKESSEGVPNQLAVPVSLPNTPPMDVPSAVVSGAYASSPSLLAWKHLTGSIPPLSASVPNMAASSPLATTSLENAKPQVKPGFLQFQDKWVLYNMNDRVFF